GLRRSREMVCKSSGSGRSSIRKQSRRVVPAGKRRAKGFHKFREALQQGCEKRVPTGPDESRYCLLQRRGGAGRSRPSVCVVKFGCRRWISPCARSYFPL